MANHALDGNPGAGGLGPDVSGDSAVNQGSSSSVYKSAEKAGEVRPLDRDCLYTG